MLLKQQLLKEDLEKILSNYTLGEVLSAKPVPSSGNISYLIKTKSGQYFLRICPDGPRYRSKEEIAAELELIEYLLKDNFPVFAPVFQKNGQVIISYKGKYGYLREYDWGESILNPNLEEIEQFGKVLGWFHSLAEGFKTKNKREHIFDLEETKKHFNLNKDLILKSNFKKATELVKKVDDELSQLNFPNNLPKGMIHEDLGKRHVLWKSGEIVGIIDFDRAYYGQLVLDLGQALRGWCFINDWTSWSNQNFQALITGYQSKRKLTDLEKQYLFDAIKFAVLERGISFCLRFIEVTHDPKDEDYSFKSAFDFLEILWDNKQEINKVLKI